MTKKDDNFRVEKDSLGEMSLEKPLPYGIHTARALENFFRQEKKVPMELIRAMILIKRAAASINGQLGFLNSSQSEAIIRACDFLLQSNDLESYFPLPAIQGGAGTSSHMNVNEVIANLAIRNLGGQNGDYRIVHPIEEVNLFQSTNDVYPSALKIASIELLLKLAEELARLQEALQEKEKEFADVLKVGRTELQDALPITLGQEFGAFADAIARDRWRVFKSEERLRSLNIGGTAVGTGSGAPKIFLFRIIEELRHLTGLGISRAENMIDATQNMDAFAEVSGILKAVAVNYLKISGDLRLMSSGPRAGWNEVTLPPRQAGSSIMPGKVNPVIPEFVASLAIQSIACDSAITYAASSGQMELNAFVPLIAVNLIDSIKYLTWGAMALTDFCIQDIRANKEICHDRLEQSKILITVLTPYIGYEKAADLIKTAEQKNQPLRKTVLESGLFSPEELDIIFDPRQATSPGISGGDELKDRIRAQGLYGKIQEEKEL